MCSAHPFFCACRSDDDFIVYWSEGCEVRLKTTPYWWEDARRETETGQDLPTTADVAVVGSGYTGLTAALVLARAGLSVVVMEAGVPGEGASSRNGGMVGPSFHKLGISGLRSKFGSNKTHEILKESVGFVGFLRDFLTAEGIDAGFAQTGRFRGALKPEHFDGMARELESLQNACGVKGHMVSRQDQQHETGSARFPARSADLRPVSSEPRRPECRQRWQMHIFSSRYPTPCRWRTRWRDPPGRPPV